MSSWSGSCCPWGVVSILSRRCRLSSLMVVVSGRIWLRCWWTFDLGVRARLMATAPMLRHAFMLACCRAVAILSRVIRLLVVVTSWLWALSMGLGLYAITRVAIAMVLMLCGCATVASCSMVCRSRLAGGTSSLMLILRQLHLKISISILYQLSLKVVIQNTDSLNFRIFRFFKIFKIFWAIFDRFEGIHILQNCQNTASLKP